MDLNIFEFLLLIIGIAAVGLGAVVTLVSFPAGHRGLRQIGIAIVSVGAVVLIIFGIFAAIDIEVDGDDNDVAEVQSVDCFRFIPDDLETLAAQLAIEAGFTDNLRSLPQERCDIVVGKLWEQRQPESPPPSTSPPPSESPPPAAAASNPPVSNALPVGDNGGSTTSTNEAAIAVTEGTIAKGSAAILRIINGTTAIVCYSEALPQDVTISSTVAAWSTPSRKPWGWMIQDATTEADNIRNGSLASMGVRTVDGPRPCK